MKCRVRLTRSVELIVSAENKSIIAEWLNNMTPESAYLEADGSIDEEYSGKIICNVRDDSDVDYEIKTPKSEMDYDDLFIYVDSVGQIVRIAEGCGTNMLGVDEYEGYADYIYYDQYDLDPDLTNVDGGMILLKEMFRDKFKNTLEAVPAVLEMAYGSADINYIVLNQQK